jgi:hypothetical protein
MSERSDIDADLVNGWLDSAADDLADDADEYLASLVRRLRAPDAADEPDAIAWPTAPGRGWLIRLYAPKEVANAFDGDMLTDLLGRFRGYAADGVRIEDLVLDVDPEMPDWSRPNALIQTEIGSA